MEQILWYQTKQHCAILQSEPGLLSAEQIAQGALVFTRDDLSAIRATVYTQVVRLSMPCVS